MSGIRERFIEQAASFIDSPSPAQPAGDATDFALDQQLQRRAQVREALRRELAPATDDEIATLIGRVLGPPPPFGYEPPDRWARVVSRTLAAVVAAPGTSLHGRDHLATARARPVLFLANHLSYSDANLFDWLLWREGFGDVADRITVLVGPKVYGHPGRRLSSLCFGAVQTPQSVERASGSAVMPRREVARLAEQTFAAVAARRAAGDHLLIFVEGTRSRTGGMQAALPAVSRYLDDPSTAIVPVGITGSEKIIPVGVETTHVAVVEARIGPSLEGAMLRRACEGARKLAMDVIGLAIADELPEPYRGVYGEPHPDLEAGRGILASVRAETADRIP